MLPISTLLVDDNPVFLDSASRFLAADEQVKIVGHAHSGHEAIEQVVRLQPDLIVMDVSMPGMNGLEATRQIKSGTGYSSGHSPFVVILTIHDHPTARAAATEAQADGFVAKSQFCTELLPLIRTLQAKLLPDSNG